MVARNVKLVGSMMMEVDKTVNMNTGAVQEDIQI